MVLGGAAVERRGLGQGGRPLPERACRRRDPRVPERREDKSKTLKDRWTRGNPHRFENLESKEGLVEDATTTPTLLYHVHFAITVSHLEVYTVVDNNSVVFDTGS